MPSSSGLSLLSALSSWGWKTERVSVMPDADCEPVRCAMRERLRCLRGAGVMRLAVKVETSGDVRALWDLRPTLMQVLAAEAGEARARQDLQALDACFLQVWAQAPVSRRSALR